MARNTKGFSLAIVITAVVIIGVLGLLSWKLWGGSPQPATKDPGTAQHDTSPSKTETNTKELSLAQGSVKFDIPKTWDVSKGDCVTPASHMVVCREGTKLIPAEKMPLSPGSNEYFTVYVSAYNNAKRLTAQNWFETEYDAGFAMDGSQASHDTINGYETYYYRQINDSYDEINYVYSHDDEVVLLTARVSTTHYASDGSGKADEHDDFTRYVPDIENMAKSIKFQ